VKPSTDHINRLVDEVVAKSNGYDKQGFLLSLLGVSPHFHLAS